MIAGYPTDVINGQEFSRFPSAVPGANLYLINTLDEWRAFYALMRQQSLVACDTETTGFQWYKYDEVCGLSFGWKDTHVYVPLRHKTSIQYGDPPAQLSIDVIRDDLIEFFSDRERTTIWFNAKFDLHFYKREGISVLCKIQDASILWHFYNENAPGALKTICSGWKDELGREHKGLVPGAANLKETEISNWRTKEAKLRREAFRKMVMATADDLKTDIAHQDKTRNKLKKWIAENLLNDHPFAKNGKEDVDYSYVPVPLMVEYAALDTFLTYKVYEFCVKNISWTPALTALYKNESQLLLTLFHTEESGVQVDVDFLRKAGVQFDVQIQVLIDTIQRKLSGGKVDENGNPVEINLQSTKQLSEALLKHGVKLTKLTDTSTEDNPRLALDKKVLAKLRHYDVVDDILKLRELTKLKGTYVDGILKKLTSNNILHCQFRQNVATGRMASSDPNLQNIPARDNTIRSSFIVPNSDYVYILADYSQIEVRLTAHYSQDPLLLDAYAKGQDVHTRTFCEMFGHDIDFVNEVLKDSNHPLHHEFNMFRTVAKRINFGIIYGVGAPGLSEQIPRPEQYKDYSDSEWIDVCQGFIDQYLDKYIGVRRFVRQGSRLVAKNSELTNYFGRVRHLPHANACKITGNRGLYWMEKRAQRQGVNFLIQGCQDPAAPVLTTHGYVPIQDLEKHGKPPLVTYTGTEADYTVLNTGEKECVNVETSISSGVCSTEHKFFVLNEDVMDLEFRSICDLPVGSLVVAANADVSGKYTSRVSTAKAELIGTLIGDGSYGVVHGTNGSRTKRYIRNCISIACGLDLDWASYCRDLIHTAYPGATPKIRAVRKPTGNINYVVYVENKAVREDLLNLGLLRVVKQNKCVPDWILTQPRSTRIAVLRGLMNTDGGISGHSIGFTNKSKQVAESVQLLLQSIGIHSFVRVYGGYYRLRIKQEHIQRYLDVVGFWHAHKTTHAQKYATTRYTKDPYPKVLVSRVLDVVKSNGLALSKSQETAIRNGTINKYGLLSILNMCPPTSETLNLKDLCSLTWAVIRKVTPVGIRPTMDLELHGTDHSYICRGLVQHNTAADLFKIAIVRISKILEGTRSRLVNFVHDEVQIYMHKDELHLLDPIRKAMEDWNFSVPIVADFAWSKTSWGAKQKIK